MSLYDDASLIVYPSGYKASKIYAQKPVNGAGDLTFARASAATRVNAEGLIETAAIIGAEFVTNGDFATDSNWTKDANWSISGGKATSTGAGRMFQPITYLELSGNVGTQVIVSFDIVDYTSAGVVIDCYGAVSPLFSGVGSYSFIGTTTNTTNLYINNSGQGSLVGSIENVSVKEYTTSNIPRIDYSNGCGSLLLEPQRTNSITYSEDFANAVWTPNGVVATLSSGTAPDGTNTLNDVSSNNSNVQENRFRYATSLAVSTTYTVSIFCKVKDINNFYIRDLTGGGGVSIINVATSTALVTGSGSTISIVDFGSGIKRVIITFTTPSSIGNNLIDFGITSSNTNRQSAIAVGSGMYWWGAQIEAGSYATSYIPTSGTTVTRNRDESLTSGLSSVVNSVEGVIFLEMSALANDSTNRYISINNGTSSKRILIKFGTSSNNIAALGLGTASSFSLSYSGAAITNMNKIALKYKANDCALWVNGVEVATDTTFTAYAASTLTTIAFSNFSGGGQWLEAKVQNLMVFPSALTDIELAALTT